ncbi:phospholipase D family protein [Sorangium sp. So ce321]|uniref:phospholipase D family protein n=1 Tax=Sorangium sp. So ce321 TaxID=3133300 RepID=UPI003F646304
MLRVVSGGLWTELHQLAKKSRPHLGAVAYVTSDERVKFGKGDTLICDATDAAIRSGQTSAAVLRRAHDRGARLFSSPGLHAKVFLLGRVAVVGSANLSATSVNELEEAALISDDARAVSGVRLLIENLVQAADEIDERFLRRIEKLPVVQAQRGSRRRRSVRLAEPRAWLISVVPLEGDKHADEDLVVESERAKAGEETQFSDSEPGYIRFTGTSSFRRSAKPGDLVIAIWRPNAKSSRAHVFAPEPLLGRKDQHGVTHLFVEEYADREDTRISWTEFSRLWRRTTSSRPPGVRSTRKMPVELLEQLRTAWPK